MDIFVTLLVGMLAGLFGGMILADGRTRTEYIKYCMASTQTKAEVLRCQTGTFPWEEK